MHLFDRLSFRNKIIHRALEPKTRYKSQPKVKLKATAKLSGNDGKIRVRLGTKLSFQNNILLANGFVAKANQIFGFIQCKAVFNNFYMLFSKKWFDVKVWQRFLPFANALKLLHARISKFCCFFDTYMSLFTTSVCIVVLIELFFGNLIICANW